MAPFTPSSSQEIICISPPPTQAFKLSKGKARRVATVPTTITTSSFAAATDRPKASQDHTPTTSKRHAMSSSQSRSRVTERMLKSLNSARNPITHSDAFSRTQHVHSASTGHQQRGGDRGFWASSRDMGLRPDTGPEHTYWSVRTANVEAAARDKITNVLAGCVIAINGSTGPNVSNLQLQNLITSNGGRYVPHQSSRCTHVVAARLSGTKAQKYLKGQGGRGAAMRTQVVKVEWILDCIAQDSEQSVLSVWRSEQGSVDFGSTSGSS